MCWPVSGEMELCGERGEREEGRNSLTSLQLVSLPMGSQSASLVLGIGEWGEGGRGDKGGGGGRRRGCGEVSEEFVVINNLRKWPR